MIIFINILPALDQPARLRQSPSYNQYARKGKGFRTKRRKGPLLTFLRGMESDSQRCMDEASGCGLDAEPDSGQFKG